MSSSSNTRTYISMGMVCISTCTGHKIRQSCILRSSSTHNGHSKVKYLCASIKLTFHLSHLIGAACLGGGSSPSPSSPVSAGASSPAPAPPPNAAGALITPAGMYYSKASYSLSDWCELHIHALMYAHPQTTQPTNKKRSRTRFINQSMTQFYSCHIRAITYSQPEFKIHASILHLPNPMTSMYQLYSYCLPLM